MSFEGVLTMSTRELTRLSVIEKVIDKRLTQIMAAQHLGLTVRQIKRLVKRYRHYGPKGLISKHRGSQGNRKYTEKKIALIKGLIETHYHDFGPKFAAEKLYERHGIKVNKETLRQLMVEWGVWEAKRQKQAQIHPQRDRRECFGELIQIDGSPHPWFEERGPKCCLLVAIDDATSQLCSLHFEPTETTAGYFKLMHKHIVEHGIPLATYSDRHGIFRINLPTAGEDTETQFGRAARQLGIEVICARSPEAKGRVERANQTLQDRLVKEMRLCGISDIEAANAYLPTYMKDHNKRFAVEAKSQENAHRKELPTDEEMNLIFSYQDERTLSKNLELSYDNMIYQIKTNTKGYRLRHSIVTVCKDLNEIITLVCHGKILDYTCHNRAKRNAAIIDSKQIGAKMDSIRNKAKGHIPAANHPWRHFIINPIATETYAQKTRQNGVI
jgi:transposase